MFDSSQDSTPASTSQSPVMNFGSVPSVRKRGRNASGAMLGYHNDENSINGNLMFNSNSNLSQESFMGSQFSQDMSDRINLISFRGGGSQDDSSVSYFNRPEEDSLSGQFVPFKKHLKESESGGGGRGTSSGETEAN